MEKKKQKKTQNYPHIKLQAQWWQLAYEMHIYMIVL